MYRTLTVAALVAGLLLAGCGGGEEPDTVGTEFDPEVVTGESPASPTGEASPTAEAGAQVTLVDFEIDAPALVDEGITAVVINEGDAPHTFTATEGAFDTGRLQPGEQTTVTFDETGTFEYECTIHPELMNGAIQVESD